MARKRIATCSRTESDARRQAGGAGDEMGAVIRYFHSGMVLNFRATGGVRYTCCLEVRLVVFAHVMVHQVTARSGGHIPGGSAR